MFTKNPQTPSLERLLEGARLQGDRSLLSECRRAILISRTRRGPLPASDWIEGIKDAVRRATENKEVLVTGLGRTPFDVSLACCRAMKGPAIVVLDSTKSLDTWAHYAHGLLPDRHLLVWPEKLAFQETSESGTLPFRDALLGRLANKAFAIGIRPGGHMHTVALELEARACEVIRIDVKEKLEPRNVLVPIPLPGFQERKDPWPCLSHFTREPNGRWPDENPGTYADWLAFGNPADQRTAFDALGRILEMRTILGSGRLMPGRTRMLSLTALPPWRLHEIIRWRRGLGRWSFRPYGIALPAGLLTSLGVQPVRYLSNSELKKLTPQERLYAQKHEPPKTDWSGESEWRLQGDLVLSDDLMRRLTALVPTAAEAECIQARFHVRAEVIT